MAVPPLARARGRAARPPEAILGRVLGAQALDGELSNSQCKPVATAPLEGASRPTARRWDTLREPPERLKTGHRESGAQGLPGRRGGSRCAIRLRPFVHVLMRFLNSLGKSPLIKALY